MGGRLTVAVAGMVLVAACSGTTEAANPSEATGTARVSPDAPASDGSATAGESRPGSEDGSGSGNSPTEAVTAFFEAGQSMDQQAALAVVCESDQAQFEAEPDPNERIVSFAVGRSEEVLPGLAKVAVRFSDATGLSDVVEVPVLREQLGWRVCFSQGYRL